MIPLHGEQVSGEVTVLSYAQTEAGALLTLVARPAQLSPADPGRAAADHARPACRPAAGSR